MRGWVFLGAVIMGLCFGNCGNPPQKFATKNTPEWDVFFDSLPDTLSRVVSRKMGTFQHHALPPDLAGHFQLAPNVDEEFFFPFGKTPLDAGHTGYLVSIDDDGDENVWLYVWDKDQARWALPLVYLAYQYCEEERCEGLVSQLICPPNAMPQIIKQESSWFPTLDSIPDEPALEKNIVLKWTGDGFIE